MRLAFVKSELLSEGIFICYVGRIGGGSFDKEELAHGRRRLRDEIAWDRESINTDIGMRLSKE